MSTSTSNSDLPEIMTNGVAHNLLHIGSHCFVRIGDNSNSAKVIGFVDSANATKNVQTQDARVIGSVLPASIDAVGVDIQISLTGFIATQEVYNSGKLYNGGGEQPLSVLNPNPKDYVDGKVTKYPYMDFKDTKTNQILAVFKDVIMTSFRVTMQAASYVKADITLKAISMD